MARKTENASAGPEKKAAGRTVTRSRIPKEAKDAKAKTAAVPASPEAQKPPSDSKKPLRRVLMNVLDAEQMRVAIAGPGGLEELYIERSANGFVHGNIYKGKVQNMYLCVLYLSENKQ